jgi:hypothetical protein
MVAARATAILNDINLSVFDQLPRPGREIRTQILQNVALTAVRPRIFNRVI